jgi:VWFA-related protein
MKTLCIILVGMAGLVVPGAWAQTPDQEPELTFRTGVDVISVDVAVVDRRGRPVEDLLAPDFAVRINGTPRRVVSADLVKYDIEAVRRQVADAAETFYTTNLTPPQGRQIVIAVDQIHIRPGSIRHIMTAAAQFVDHLSPLDQISFIAFPEPGPRLGFTRDRLRIRLAMERLIGHQPRWGQFQYNIGITEAMDIAGRRDQIVIATVSERECRRLGLQAREQCERDVILEADQIARAVRQDAEDSLTGLHAILRDLARVEGHKSLVLISEALAVDDENQLRSIVSLAGMARTSINVLLVDRPLADVTIVEQPPTETQDRRILTRGLEGLATMSLGALFRVVGTGEPIFDRLASELSAYYLLGVEQQPGDAIGDRHRIDVEVRRRDVTIRSRQAFVLSPTLNARRSPQDNLRDALLSPFGTAGVPLRVTTFAQQDPSSDKVQLLVAADVAEPGAEPAPYLVGLLLVDDENRVVASMSGRHTLRAAGTSGTEPLTFLAAVTVDPGIYSLRFGVVDEEGRRGSVVREVSAWKMRGETLATGDLFIGNLPAAGGGVQATVEPHIADGALAAYLELYSTSAALLDGTNVTFEVAADEDAPALVTMPAQLSPGQHDAWRVATGMVGVRMLPPGQYVARARIMHGDEIASVLARPFVLEPRTPTVAPSPVELTAASFSFAETLPAFDGNVLLRPDFVAGMLDLAEHASPGQKGAIELARAGRYGAGALEALGSGDQTVAAFLRGIDLYSKGQLNEAATQLQIAAGPRREFFPAAVYLGASYAAVGRDRDAAGVWQIALGSEPRAAEIYTMVADARVRDGQPASAIDVLAPAYTREPANDELARRMAVLYLITGRYSDALPVLDGYLARHPSEQELLLAAIVAEYETVRAGRVLSNADRDKIRRYAAAYQGSERALVDRYLEVMDSRR